jgi:hypothetical protein
MNRCRIPWFPDIHYSQEPSLGFLRKIIYFIRLHLWPATVFDMKQFTADCLDNMNHVMKSPALRTAFGVEFKPMILKNPAVNAGVSPSAPDQYLIWLNTGLLDASYKFLVGPVSSYYQRHEARMDVSKDLFLRIVLASAALTAFWHEFAHAVRGHLNYKLTHGLLTSLGSSEADEPQLGKGRADASLIGSRTLELDADIFGAQFFLAQMSVTLQANYAVRPATFAQCYAIGLRGLYEVLNGLAPHDDAAGNTHPHPISRAYTAYSQAMKKVGQVKLTPQEQAQMVTVGQIALQEFEVEDLGAVFDQTVLDAFMQTELAVWRARRDELKPYQLNSSRTLAQV